MNDFLSGSIGLGIVLFLFVLAILWFLLPFAIFGTKDKLSELIAESKKTNEQLSALRAEVAEIKGNDDPIINLTCK
jgi:hypothetical protein